MMKRSTWLWGGLAMAGAALMVAGCLIPGINAPANNGTISAGQTPGLSAARRISPTEDQEVLPSVVQLNWTAVSGATAYDVYLGVDTLPPLIAEVTNTSIVVRDLQSCTDQYWRVVAIVGDQQISSPTWSFSTSCN